MQAVPPLPQGADGLGQEVTAVCSPSSPHRGQGRPPAQASDAFCAASLSYPRRRHVTRGIEGPTPANAFMPLGAGRARTPAESGRGCAARAASRVRAELSRGLDVWPDRWCTLLAQAVRAGALFACPLWMVSRQLFWSPWRLLMGRQKLLRPSLAPSAPAGASHRGTVMQLLRPTRGACPAK